MLMLDAFAVLARGQGFAIAVLVGVAVALWLIVRLTER